MVDFVLFSVSAIQLWSAGSLALTTTTRLTTVFYFNLGFVY